VRHQVGAVDRDVAVEPLQVFGDAAPVPVEARRVVVPALDLAAQLDERRIVDRGIAEAILAEHFGGDALAEF